MTNLYPQDWFSYLSVLLVFLRFLGLFLLMPGFSHPSVPMSVKIALAFSLSLALFPIVQADLPAIPQSLSGLFAVVLRETVIGFLMGFVAHLTFEAINLAAQLVGYQMGFGTASLVDPQNQSQVSLMVPLHGWIALMVFFIADMHHGVIQLLLISFKTTRTLDAAAFSTPALITLMTALVGKLFVLAVQMSAPFTLLVLGVNAAIGVLSRLLPQMNVILFSFPITILLGFMAFYLLAPDIMSYLEVALGEMSVDVMRLLKTL